MNPWKKWTVLILFCLPFLFCGAALAEGTLLLPDMLTEIGEDAFRGNTGLTTAVVGNQVTVIGPGAFAETGLEYVFLPASVTEIGEGAFAGCDELKAIVAADSFALDWCRDAGVPYVIGTYGDSPVVFSEDTIILKNGASRQMEALPGLDVIWSCSDENILTVDENGLIFGNYPGTATLTASVSDSGLASQIPVTVQANYRALLFSGSTYDGGVIQRNRGDVQYMTAMLRSVTGPDGGIYELHSFDDQTAPQIYEKITQYLVNPSRDGDVSMFFFAGHGDRGSTSYQNAGRLYCLNRETWICLPDLAAALTQVSGKVIVVLESCGPGAALRRSVGADDSAGDEMDDAELAAAMLSVFASADPGLSVYQPPSDDGKVSRAYKNLFLTEKFEVMCAAEYLQTSYSLRGDDTVNLFPYWFAMGVGTSGEMPADVSNGNGDGVLTFNELFKYVYAQTRHKQTACCYPKNSPYQLYMRLEKEEAEEETDPEAEEETVPENSP
ncbi:MAG: leucine-rich repeat protein [Clostridia bacterium]|nr:leucine-rich repeat protein [Clostridia bacterium]MBQ6961152.1 leucine-rich repeat protein [Clostridia bacterium]MBR0220073.1 leucine-rich repeat protein [Clostridia bacterium]